MNEACTFTIVRGLDLGLCLRSIVPDWILWLWPYWPWLLGALALGLAYRFAGPLGLASMAAAIGFWLGRKSADEPVETELPSRDAAPPVKRRVRR